jgi:hypothetical protein
MTHRRRDADEAVDIVGQPLGNLAPGRPTPLQLPANNRSGSTRRYSHRTFSILVTVNWPLARSTTNLILSPTLMFLSIAGSSAR